MSERVTGFILLAIGIGIICFSAINVFSVFTGKLKPYALFNFPSITLDASNLVGSDLPPEDANALKSGGNAPKLELVQASVLNDTGNIFAHLLLMGFIASIGYKIGSLGAMLARPLVVKLKTKNGEILSENSSEEK